MLDPGLVCHRRPHVIDPQKPNVIFSSNIPLRVANCVAEMHLFLGGKTSRLVEVAPSVGELEVVIEVNSLLQRNWALTPFQLVRRNLVFVAKSKTPSKTSRIGHGSPEGQDAAGFSGVWKDVLAHKHPSEVFVASFRLALDTLTIDLANAKNMTIEFHHDELFELLAMCDGVVAEISGYLRQCLLAELKNNTDISTDIASSSTILQELPFNELASLIRQVQSRNLFGLDSTSFIDTTVEGMDSLIEKQDVVFEDDDFDVSGDDIKILHSDDSGKCTANEDDEDHGRASRINSISHDDIQELMKSDIENIGNEVIKEQSNGRHEIVKHGSDTNKGVLGTSSNQDVNIIDGINKDTSGLNNRSQKSGGQGANWDINTQTSEDMALEEDNDTKFSDFHNLRNNGRSENNKSHSLNDPELSYEVEEFNIDDYTPEHYEEDDFQRALPTKSAPMILNESSPLASPVQHVQTTLMTPIGPGHAMSRQTSTPEMQIRKKSSFAYISSDDNSGLQFAFRDTSEDVPSFIKENKKFKFIKVGKVQKFVSLFEEQMDKDGSAASGNNVGSRVSTRPGSPLKTDG